MTKIAFLTANCMFEDHPEAREDHWEHDLEFTALASGCAARGIELVPVVWDDPGLDVREFAALVIGTTWDYAAQPEAFLERLAGLAQEARLFNPFHLVRWNLEKTYLQDLAQRGVPVVPTLWRERADGATIAAAFDELGTDELVVKPVVGASAWRQVRVRRGTALPPADALPPAEAMIQPFLSAAEDEGELSFLFFDGEFSHCALKVPARGDYRVQSMYGGREHVHVPAPAELALARSILDAVDERLLYARVDMLRDAARRLVLMELELVEPYLYPEQGPELGATFAAALERILG